MKIKKHILSSAYGFTLIEILVLLVIIAIVAAMVSVSIIGADRTVRVRNLAEELSLVIPLAQQQAILQPTQIGMVFRDHSYQFYKFVTDANDPTQGDWQPIKGDTAFAIKNYSSDITIKIQSPKDQDIIDESDIYLRPQLMMFSSGDITPFIMTLAINDKAPLFKITGDANGNIKLERLGIKAPSLKPLEVNHASKQ